VLAAIKSGRIFALSGIGDQRKAIIGLDGKLPWLAWTAYAKTVALIEQPFN